MKPSIVYRLQWGVLLLTAVISAAGCSLSQAPVLDPKGPVALAERQLLFDAFALMLIVVIPVFIMTFLFALRYRASNERARYAPDWDRSTVIEAIVWLVPALIVLGLGVLLWDATHELDPYKELASDAEPVEVQAVAQDWKWLFIYPHHGIAVVNELVFPSKTPLNLRITSDTVMNSFYVPALSGQIYAMAGMQTRLSLMADEPGTFVGRNAQFSGDGFADQFFSVTATSGEGFEDWLRKVQRSPKRLDAETYTALAKPSTAHPVTYYSSVEPELFRSIIAKYAAGQRHE